MKKNLIIALIALMLFACGRDTTFTIIGTVKNTEWEGLNIILQTVEDREFIAIDTAQIINGAFTFTGSVEEPTMAEILIEADWPRLFTILILESGTIEIISEVNGKITITGTRNNNLRQPFLDAEFAINQKINDVWQNISDAEQAGDTELVAYLREEATRHWDEWTELTTEFIANNINNPAGLTQFRLPTSSVLEVEQVQRAIANANRRTQQIPVIIRATERVETLMRTAVGQPFVDLTMQDPDGNYISVSDFVGNGYLMIDFTGTWCGPCRFGKPAMIETFNRFNERGFNIIGVWFEGSHEDWVNGMAELNMPDWPQMSNLQGWNCEGRELYGILGIPHSVLIDPNGIIIARSLWGEYLNQKLEELLGE